MPDGQRFLSGSTDNDRPRVAPRRHPQEHLLKELHTRQGARPRGAARQPARALRLGRQDRQALQRQRRRRPAHLQAPHATMCTPWRCCPTASASSAARSTTPPASPTTASRRSKCNAAPLLSHESCSHRLDSSLTPHDRARRRASGGGPSDGLAVAARVAVHGLVVVEVARGRRVHVRVRARRRRAVDQLERRHVDLERRRRRRRGRRLVDGGNVGGGEPRRERRGSPPPANHGEAAAAARLRRRRGSAWSRPSSSATSWRSAAPAAGRRKMVRVTEAPAACARGTPA